MHFSKIKISQVSLIFLCWPSLHVYDKTTNPIGPLPVAHIQVLTPKLIPHWEIVAAIICFQTQLSPQCFLSVFFSDAYQSCFFTLTTLLSIPSLLYL